MSRTKIKISTTLPTSPLPLAHSRPSMLTSRLLLRPLFATDLPASHKLRSQQAVMVWTSSGTVDPNLEASETWLKRFLPPKDESTYNWAWVLRDTPYNKDEGGMVGVGGCHLFSGPEGWPELGYMLREEFWGKGLATEFVQAFVEMWWRLPRSEVEIQVADDTITQLDWPFSTDFDQVESIPEFLLAQTEARNFGSNRILEKCGFEQFREFEEDGYSLMKWRMKRPPEPSP